MSIETKERLTRLSKEKGYRIGETLSFLLDVYDNPKKDYMEEVLSLTKQNKKLLSVIEDHVETTNILFNALAKNNGIICSRKRGLFSTYTSKRYHSKESRK